VDVVSVLHEIDILEVAGNLAGDVAAVCSSSRECGPGSLFVAIPGHKQDGHDFIAAAVARGARFVVQERPGPAGAAVSIRVADSRRALGIAGRNFYGDPSARLCLIAVVGTNGKTTVTYLLEAILTAAGLSTGVLGTVNYRFGGTVLPAANTTPESLDLQHTLRRMADAGVTHVAAEVTSHAVALHRVDDCTFAAGIFTNLSQDHLDYHGTMESYFQAKKRFFTDILPRREGEPPWMICNGDDPWGRRLQREAGAGPVRTLVFGLGPDVDVTAAPFRLTPEGITATVRTPAGSFPVTSGLTGRFNLSNILAAAAAAWALGLPAQAVQRGLAALARVPGRLEKVSGPDEPQVFVDYAHTEDALRKALESLQEFRRGRIITVFGCGGDRDRGKRPLMGAAAAALSDVVVVTSDNPRTEDPLAIIADIEPGLAAQGTRKVAPEDLPGSAETGIYAVIPDRRRAIAAALCTARPADTVLIAGKGHEDYQIVGSERHPFDDRTIARALLDAAGAAECIHP
jgi:UDP-N-acetylmuramoyl-L-alanyl-D-glutamate--2,6-diaminopimelate ligase